MPDETLLPGPVPLLMARGSSFGPLIFELEDSNGAALNLTGYVPRWIARPEISSPNEFDFGAALTATPVDGRVTIELTDEETMREWPLGDYQHALTLESSGGSISQPLIAGPLKVYDQSARA